MDNIYLQTGFDFIHIMATILWFGGLFTNLFIVMPTATRVLEPQVFQGFMGALMKRNKQVVYVSLVLLFITGIPMKISSEYYVSIINFSNEWQIAMFIKHVMVALLAIFAIVNFEVIVPKLKKAAIMGDTSAIMNIKRIQKTTGKFSISLAILIIFLSAVMNYL